MRNQQGVNAAGDRLRKKVCLALNLLVKLQRGDCRSDQHCVRCAPLVGATQRFQMRRRRFQPLFPSRSTALRARSALPRFSQPVGHLLAALIRRELLTGHAHLAGALLALRLTLHVVDADLLH